MTIECAGEKLTLLPGRAVWWARKETLLLSDVHLGKAESLQAEGFPVPSEAGESDLARLEALAARTGARRVLILGDFIHRHNSWTPDLLAGLQAFFDRPGETHWHLIIGNHERGSLPYLQRLNLNLITGDLIDSPLTFTHGHHEGANGGFRIKGHVHPVMTLRDGPLKMRFPVFVLGRDSLLLPSFGTWTGGAEVEKTKGHRYFAAAPTEVFEIKT